MSGESPLSAVVPSEGASSSLQASRRVGIHQLLMVTAVVVFVATYVSIQYLIARQQVVAHMRGKGEAIEAIHIYSIRFTNSWSVWVDWEFNVQGAPEDMGDVATETSWLGLGWTKVPLWPGWTSN